MADERAEVSEARGRLHAERAEFRRQQAAAAAQEAALLVVTAVAVAATASPAGEEEDAPLQAQEFERDEDFRVLRRFMAAHRMGQHAGVLQGARGWAAAERPCTQ